MVRWIVLGLALLAGLASAQQLVHEDIRDSRCWECHSDDPNVPSPLRAFWQAIPDPEPIAGPTDLRVAIQNTWYHDIQRLSPVLDLTEAPSLTFVDERLPYNDTVLATVQRAPPTVTPATPPQILPTVETPPARGELILHVPDGATRLNVTLDDVDPDHDPEIQWRIHTAAPDPIELTSRGASAGLHFQTPQAFLLHGYGDWTVEALVPVTDAAGLPNTFGDTLEVRARATFGFDPSARLGVLSSDATVGPDQATLFTWRLQRMAAPAAGEAILLTVNGTVHHQHLVTSNAIDDAFITTTLRLPLQDGDGSTRLQSDVVLVAVPQTGGSLIVPLAEVVGYMGAISIVTSLATGGLFGRASRRWLNALFGSARQRVAFHNVLSYGIIAFSLAHIVLFLWLAFNGGPYDWTLGLIWGGVAILAMLGLGVTGALQVPMLRRWNYATWKWIHFGLAMAALLFTALHLLLDGAHFGAVQEAVGWQNPLDAS